MGIKDLVRASVLFSFLLTSCGESSNQTVGVLSEDKVALSETRNDRSLQIHSLSTAVLEIESPSQDVSPNAFGFAIDLDQSRILVGDPGDSDSRGKAYLFDAEDGELLATFFNPDPDPGDSFGFAVAIRGAHVLIGSPQDSTPGPTQTGTAHLFTSSGTHIATFTQVAPTSFDRFGFSVALTQDHGLVGVPFERSDDFGNSGAAYLYDLNEPLDAPVVFTNPTRGDDDRFGWSLALNETTALIGAPFTDIPEDRNQGAAYLYDLDALEFTAALSTSPVQLLSPNPQLDNSDSFGFSVSLSDQAAVGALNSKQVFIFDLMGNGTHEISNPFFTASNLQLFGFSLSLGSEELLVGSPGKFLVGGALRYDLVSLSPVEKFRPNPRKPISLFGLSGVHQGDLTVIGEPGQAAAILIAEAVGIDLPDGLELEETGKVYVFTN